MSARHLLLDSPALGRRAHVWCFGQVRPPVIVFPSNAGVAHEWQRERHDRRARAAARRGPHQALLPRDQRLAELLGARQLEPSAWRTTTPTSASCSTRSCPSFAKTAARRDVPMVATGCSVGALYASLFALKHPETFSRALCISGRYREPGFFGGASSHACTSTTRSRSCRTSSGAALERVRARRTSRVVVGRGRRTRTGAFPRRRELGGVAASSDKGDPQHHVGVLGRRQPARLHVVARQARHYLARI
jgi:hypothetical protein